MKKEILNDQEVPGTEVSPGPSEKLKNYPFVGTEDHEEVKAQVIQEEAINDQKYEEILTETKNMEATGQSPEEINDKIQALQKSIDTRSKDYKDLFFRYSHDTPGINSSYDASSVEILAKKYPSLEQIGNLLSLAKKKNTPQKSDEIKDGLMGKLFGARKVNPAEMSDGDYGKIKRALTSGSAALNGTINDFIPAVDFLAANAPDLLKTQAYQEVINKIGSTDKDFMEKHKNLLVSDEELNNKPVSAKHAIQFLNWEDEDKIKALENKKAGIENKSINPLESKSQMAG
ncbi:MAG: hypothetical protein ACOYL8_02880 [Patescibacteria group bacterium]